MSIENLYPSVKPSLDLNFAAGNFDPRITFSRASGATHYDGKTVAKAEENLLTKSQEFDSTPWTKSSITVISDTSLAPDGTTTADRLQESASGAASRRVEVTSPTLQVATYTLSIFAKAAELSFVRLTEASTGSARTTWFNLASGSAATTAPAHSAVVAGLGNGWYRCSITFLAGTAASSLAVGISNTDNVTSYTGNGSDGLLVWGAQLEQRSQVTAYTPTTSQPITNYVPVLQTAPANVPRIDYDPITGECKGLLIEEQRTNLLTYSEQFGNSIWLKTRSIVSANSAVAPDGTLTADKFSVDTTASQTHRINYQITLTAGVFTASVFAKASEKSLLILQINSVTDCFTWFNLATGQVGTKLAGVTSAGIVAVGDGWYRCSITATLPAGLSDVVLYPAEADNVQLISTGDGYSGIYIWGAQLEAGAFPTSYIKTEASQVTRAADSASMTGANFSSWYRQDEGTLCSDFSSSNGATPRVITLHDGTLSNQIWLRNTIDSAFSGYLNGGYQWQTTATVSVGKLVGTYKSNDIASCKNGGSLSVDASAIVPRVSTATLAAAFDGSSSLNGHIKRITYYPKRLSNTELQALTA